MLELTVPPFLYVSKAVNASFILFVAVEDQQAGVALLELEGESLFNKCLEHIGEHPLMYDPSMRKLVWPSTREASLRVKVSNILYMNNRLVKFV